MIIVKNSQLNNETIEAINSLIDLDINASSAFKLTRIIKQLSSIVEDKLSMEKKILEKWVEKDEKGEIVRPIDNNGNTIDGAVNISNIEEFTKEMNELMEIENKIDFERINFDDLKLETAKIKDLIKLEFLFN